jgi:hypothetical protein
MGGLAIAHSGWLRRSVDDSRVTLDQAVTASPSSLSPATGTRAARRPKHVVLRGSRFEARSSAAPRWASGGQLPETKALLRWVDGFPSFPLEFHAGGIEPSAALLPPIDDDAVENL